MDLGILKPNVSSFGFGLSLAVNATTIWGGAFPLLPLDFQTSDVLLGFFLAQSIAFVGAFAAAALGTYFRQAPISERLWPVALVSTLGALCLIAPFYAPEATPVLVGTGGILLGGGSACLLLLWQMVFASRSSYDGKKDLIVGTGYSAAIYAALHAIPMAVAMFMIAFVFIPTTALCLRISNQDIDRDQPMFSEAPRASAQVYRDVLIRNWRNALCVGSFGFICGMTRALAVTDPATGSIVNMASMAGALVSSLALLFLWSRYTFTFSTTLSFRTVFPYVATAILMLPAVGDDGLRLFAGIMYMFFSFATMIMMIQCAQIAQDSGVHPLFTYGFFGTIVYLLQSIGFVVGYASASVSDSSGLPLAAYALVGAWLLSISMYLVRDDRRGRFRSIEFIALDSTPTVAGPSVRQKAALRLERELKSTEDTYEVPLSERCRALKDMFMLTAREAEVIELIARGNSVSFIAERLVISQNTVRTHSKRAYVKLGVHKKQELLALLDEVGCRE